jgi:hypothetical protein
MTCARCERTIEAEGAVYSPYRRVNYCGPADWPACDKAYREKMDRMRAEDAA